MSRDNTPAETELVFAGCVRGGRVRERWAVHQDREYAGGRLRRRAIRCRPTGPGQCRTVLREQVGSCDIDLEDEHLEQW